ncbi:flagellar assembly protein FliW [Paenibacillus sp. J22TS3]|uniref:flagellar assembly protein FliW n=1 Tax=Paenibacillus sp. J22TS3 TaxID=2807192 RepID=UPI001B18B862|nr:flagellar assembly protein FliW [Paenibacillus sp. J22TS3]GIP21757.1 flagellar assembly factor FliW [Paenibacillus sp. J22TS3]
MVIIQTATWGETEVNENEIYRFEKGIPGFEDNRSFVLLDQGDHPFYYMQSTEDQELAFVVVDPFLFYSDYEFELSESEKEELGIESLVEVWCVLTLNKQAELSTINLLAPIVLNPEQHTGKQVVLHQTSYQTKHPLRPAGISKSNAQKEGE